MTNRHQVRPELHIRWMIRRDMEEVQAIERASFHQPWTEADFISELRERNQIGMVAEINGPRVGPIVGFMVYGLFKRHLDIRDFAVDPEHRRHGVGLAMIEKLTAKLLPQRRTRIRVVQPDSNLDGHLFLRSAGFEAVEIVRGMFEEPDVDGYLFEYVIPMAVPVSTHNGQRIHK